MEAIIWSVSEVFLQCVFAISFIKNVFSNEIQRYPTPTD